MCLPDIDSDYFQSEPQQKDVRIEYIYTFSNPKDYHYITHNEVNAYDFSKGFAERIGKNTQYIRPYLDIDHIETMEQYNEFIAYLETIKKILGDYSIGGYTNNQEIAEETGLKYIKDASKVVSFHVVFYKASCTPKDMLAFVRDHKNELEAKHIDTNVYKLNTSQLMRHCLSDKRVKLNEIHKTAGNILHGLEPSTQIITAMNNDNQFTSKELGTAFGFRFQKEFDLDFDDECYDEIDEIVDGLIAKQKQKTTRRQKNQKNYKIDDIEFEDNLIKLSSDEVLKLLNDITTQPHNEDLVHTIVPLYHSPYNIDFIIDVVEDWYNQIDHKTPDSPAQIIKSIYKEENTNKWLFSLIKKVTNTEKRNEWLNKFKHEHVDFNININNSTWCYNDIAKRVYTFNQFGKLLTDLRGVIGFVGSRYFTKELDTNLKQYVIKEHKKEGFNDMLSKRKPFKGNNKINLCQIANEYSNYFLYDDIRLFQYTEENKELSNTTINIFQGYKYNEIKTEDFSILEPLLDHIKNVNCNGNEAKYEYIMMWFANIIQNLAVKNGTMPIMYGSQGSGKSMFVEIMCELLGHLAVPNADDLDKVFGKFNKLNENKVLIVLNEIGEANDRFAYSEKMKSRITQANTLIESKGVDTRMGMNYANYIMTANYPDPIVAQKGDRRTIYFPTNNKHCGDSEYFKSIFKNIQPKKQGDYNPEYMGVLLHYMLTQWNPNEFDFEKLIVDTNNNTQTNYNENLERQYECLDGVSKYVVDHYELFKIGYPIDWVKIEGYKTTGIAKKLKAICEEPRRLRFNSQAAKDMWTQYDKIEGFENHYYSDFEEDWCKITKQYRFYKLKDREQIKDLYNIIDYKNYQSKCEDQ